MAEIINRIFDLFARYGAEQYGEDLSLERHMLQSAAMAEAQGGTQSVIAAALLHDIGYFVHSDNGQDDSTPHEALAAAWLAHGFETGVTAPIALHVQAKRYLCAVEPDYVAGLSTASRLSLAVQGGVMTADEAAGFARDPAFDAAVLLRRCDDRGKDVSLRTHGITHYRDLLAACLRPELR